MTTTTLRARWARPMGIAGLALAVTLPACGHSRQPAASPATSSASSSTTSSTTAGDVGLRDGFVTSTDGTKIHYREGGRGELTLFFLHGWLGNAHWWDEQLAHFGPRYRVVAMDQAGCGQSGRDRKAWTMQASAEDARAVADRLGLSRIVWVGHSMSGWIIVEAANRMPERTVGLIAVDTLNDIGAKAPPEEMEEEIYEPLEKNFVPAAQTIIKNALVPSSPEPVARRLMTEASAAPADISITLLRRTHEYDIARAIRSVKAPIMAINSDHYPTNLDANRKLAPQFDVLLMKNVGHWPMLERPSEFDALLQRAIDRAATPSHGG